MSKMKGRISRENELHVQIFCTMWNEGVDSLEIKVDQRKKETLGIYPSLPITTCLIRRNASLQGDGNKFGSNLLILPYKESFYSDAGSTEKVFGLEEGAQTR